MICPHCGAESKQRSSPQHRRFFKLIEVAYHHWPEYTEFVPDSSEHLRAWLLCKSKHRNAVRIDSPGELSSDAIEMMRKVLRAAGAYAFIVPSLGVYFVLSPKSMSYGKMGHEEANKVMSDVENLICMIFEVNSGDELLRKHDSAA